VIATYIDRRIQAGSMRPVDSRMAGRAFFGMIAHYAMTGLLFGCGPFNQSPEKVVESMVGIFIQGMCKEDSK